MWSSIRDWWRGKYVPYENDPRSMFMLIGGRYERPAIARILRPISRIWMAHWQMILGVVGVVVAALGLVR